MKYLVFIGVLLFVISCGEEPVYTPKPRMYPRIVYPIKSYNDFDFEACNFTFKKPRYAKVKSNVEFFNEKPNHPCWFDLNIDSLNTSMHFSYTEISKKEPLDKLVNDAFKLAAKHNVKAEYREEFPINNKNGVSGLIFNIEGPVASPINFYLTDSTKHFVRASLYFNSSVNPDSIAPVLSFVNEDIKTIIETFRWNDGIDRK